MKDADIITGEVTDVTEHSGSQNAKPGNILFGSIVKMDQVALLEASASFMFPPIEKAIIIPLRTRIKDQNIALTKKFLIDYSTDYLEIYHDIVNRLLNPVMPKLQNTDGDPLLMHTLLFVIESPRAAFDTLKDLCITHNEEELLSDATFDTDGNLHKVVFAWEHRGNSMHSSWDNTILAHITIEGKLLTVNVNSEKRAKKFHAIMEKRIPKARYKTTAIESPQAMVNRQKSQKETQRSIQREKEQEALANSPEVQAHLSEMMKSHYREWIKMKIPVLGGKTPLQAVKKSDGREMVEALIVDIELKSKQIGSPLDPAIIMELRKNLRLLRSEILA